MYITQNRQSSKHNDEAGMHCWLIRYCSVGTRPHRGQHLTGLDGGGLATFATLKTSVWNLARLGSATRPAHWLAPSTAEKHSLATPSTLLPHKAAISVPPCWLQCCSASLAWCWPAAGLLAAGPCKGWWWLAGLDNAWISNNPLPSTFNPSLGRV